MSDSTPLPAGFGNCPRCAYRAVGPPSVCQACAARTLQPATPYSCPVCGQQLASAHTQCGNALCRDPGRYFVSNTAIAMKTGALDTAIKQHKYEGRSGWGIIAARVILGFLPHWPILPRVDLIIPMPTFLPAGTPRQGNDQAGWTLQSAIEQDEDNHPFRVDPPVIVKTAPTARMATASGLGERRAIAGDIYDVLRVVDHAAVRHRTVVVYDDVFTTGSTLNAVAQRLREAGATAVYGLTLARAPWR